MIITVDENDTIIGEVERYKRKPTDIHRVSALWVTNSEWDILLAKRHKNKKSSPGLWGPAVAGTVELWETYESNIIKETEEEIGLTGIELIPNIKLSNLDAGSPHFTQWYTAIVNWDESSFRAQENEVEEIRWWTPLELGKALKETPEIFLKRLWKYFQIFHK